MEPGPRAEGFVNNVEGVVRRFLDVLEGQIATADAEDQERMVVARDWLSEMIEGRGALHDPDRGPRGGALTPTPASR